VTTPPYLEHPNVNLVRYRGGPGMVAWAFHRISGLSIFVFVLLHVIDIYLIGDNAELYNELLAFYASVPGRILEVLLGAALLYHSLNGLRIIIIDFWPRMTVYHRFLWWASWVIFVVVGVPGALIILRPLWTPWLAGLGL
jgi:succinate dehydrogenase / fumarate reductase cytochrome b subunit